MGHNTENERAQHVYEHKIKARKMGVQKEIRGKTN